MVIKFFEVFFIIKGQIIFFEYNKEINNTYKVFFNHDLKFDSNLILFVLLEKKETFSNNC